MSDYENDDQCWSALEGFRVALTSIIDPSRITPYLRQCKVLNPDDEEQVLSDPSLVIRKRKAGVLLDILQRTGHKGYVAFLESLELYYPQLYKKVTGKEPARAFSMIIDASGESSLTQLLMTEVLKLQKKVQDLTVLLRSQEDLAEELRLKDGLLRQHQERAQRLKEECEAGGRELKRCKEENYDLAMRLARQSEEKGAAIMRNRDLQLEIDGLKHSLMKAEDDCTVQRKHTLKLRHAMEQQPSQDLLWQLQQEKEQLQARLQGLEASVQCLEEKEMFELQCLALRKDSKMYKERIEAILQQMEEVATERDQAMATREELHKQFAQNLQEKDQLRKRVRELGEKADDLQLQLFQRQAQLQTAEGRLRRQQLEALVLQSSDLEDGSPGNSQEVSAPQECWDLHPLRPGWAPESLSSSTGGDSSGHTQLKGQEQEHSCGSQNGLTGQSASRWKLSFPQDLEEDTQLSDKGALADGESPEQPLVALQKEHLSMTTPNDAGLTSGEPPEKERRRLKESFENYRRKRALRKAKDSCRREEADREHTTGSDNSDTEGS
ncbi:caspase recruitment domain-containing protein 9 isoform X3 [Nycticebus coucang]|uniref:caspase recruitment domain-containing protein 9 isoform X3 n=1 Tax=Nycticebus coucang TaxID=9470 RepID=UPI00234D96BE|nr:caspase recruitment domain-containing protein 9 isoform X3 [Nycticebus coucang]